MKKWFNRSAILLLLVGIGWYSKAKYCEEFPAASICAVPTPTPTPAPTPTAEPTPVPVNLCADNPTLCDDGFVCVDTEMGPACEPKPTPQPPTPTPPATCGVRLDGDPKMDINQHASVRNYDGTPKIYNADRCTEVGFVNRQTCPVTPEGDPRRGPCECELMTGTATATCSPVWEMRNATGTLRIELEDGWMGRLYGSGSGQIRACYPNGRACSAWTEVSL